MEQLNETPNNKVVQKIEKLCKVTNELLIK